MKQVQDLVNDAREMLSTSTPTTTGDQRMPETNSQRRAVNRIFATLKTTFPAWYEKHFGDERAEALGKRVWLFVTEDLTEQQIDAGLRRLAARAKNPPSPAEFIEMAMEVPGVPGIAEAWIQALRGSYTHEVVKVAAQKTGTFDLQRSRPSDRTLQKQFEYHYAIILRRFQNGEALDGEVTAAIGHDSQKTDAQRAHEYAEQQLRDRIAQQSIPTDPSAARAALFASLGINRNAAVAVAQE